MARLGLTLWSAASLMFVAAGPALAAPGDTCAEATSISALPFSKNGTTCGAGDDFTNDAGGTAICSDLPRGYGGGDTFFKLDLEQGNQVAFDLALPGGSTGDLALFLVRAPSCAGPLTCAGNSVDLIGAGVGPERIKANAQAYPAGTYYLIVDSNLSAPDPASCGAYALTVTGHLSAFCGNGAVDPGEACDDGNTNNDDCCTNDCQTKAAAGKICRAAAGLCDVAETCNADGTCPANSLRPAGMTCRPAAGVCDIAEQCDGVTAACGPDRFFTAGALCRQAQGICDQTERCTGNSADCPVNGFQPAGVACGAPSLCQKAPICNGAGVCSPAQPVSCDDGNACTLDSCSPIAGCQHANMCRDAGADATSVDAMSDSAAPDGPARDAAPSPMDTGVVEVNMQSIIPDVLPASPDARLIDSAVDSASSREAGASAVDGAQPAPDSAGPSPDGAQTGPDSLGDNLDGSTGLHDVDGGSAIVDDAATGGKTDLPFAGGTNALAGKDGCSCHLGAGHRSSDASSGALLGVAFIALALLRRRAS